MHPSAYTDCGLCHLPFIKQITIARIPDLKDSAFNSKGLEQMLKVAELCTEKRLVTASWLRDNYVHGKKLNSVKLGRKMAENSIVLKQA